MTRSSYRKRNSSLRRLETSVLKRILELKNGEEPWRDGEKELKFELRSTNTKFNFDDDPPRSCNGAKQRDDPARYVSIACITFHATFRETLRA